MNPKSEHSNKQIAAAQFPLASSETLSLAAAEERQRKIEEDAMKTQIVGYMKEEVEKVKKSLFGPKQKRQPLRRTFERIGRNEPCPCGSLKKFKRCCQGVIEGGTK